VLTQDDLEACDSKIVSLVDEAVSEAREADFPTEADLLTDVYVNY
jgi:pyruvate dehydrogenase E1 component alpha subunit